MYDKKWLFLLCVAAVGIGVETAEATSLYRESTFQAPVSDRKAVHKRGDVLTVVIFEQSSAVSAANTSAGRETGVRADADWLGEGKGAGVRARNQHEGRGQTRREGRVLGQLTVTVRDVAPNGDLLVDGEQLLEVNNERQQIRVEGRVRRQDVSEANTVLSTRMADARISFVGFGDLADRQQPSWWGKLLGMFGL